VSSFINPEPLTLNYRCVTSFLCFGGKFGTGKLIELFLISVSLPKP